LICGSEVGVTSDRRDIADKVEAELIIERNVDRVLRVQQQKCVAVGRHVDHGFGCDVAGGARPHLDKELLAKLFRQELSDQTCDHVGRAARRLANDDFHRARRIGLRAYGSRKHRRTRSRATIGVYRDSAAWSETLAAAGLKLRLHHSCEYAEGDKWQLLTPQSQAADQVLDALFFLELQGDPLQRWPP